MVGEEEGDPSSEMTHRHQSGLLVKGMPQAKFVVLPRHKHNTYFWIEPDAAHREIRAFLGRADTASR